MECNMFVGKNCLVTGGGSGIGYGAAENRMATPAEVGGFIRYLASDGASYITGVSLTMAGGKMLI